MIADLRSCRWIEPDSSLRQSKINNRQSSIPGVIFVVVFSPKLVMRNDFRISGQTLAMVIEDASPHMPFDTATVIGHWAFVLGAWSFINVGPSIALRDYRRYSFDHDTVDHDLGDAALLVLS